MDTVTCDQILHELFTVIKLVTYTLVSTIVLLVKNYVLPARLIEKKIEDQIVLITGAANGIGKEIVKKMLQLNCKLVCVDIKKDDLKKLEEELAATLKPKQNYVHFYNFDISNLEEVKKNCKKIRNEVGDVDILVNNAGIMNKAKLFMELKEEEILNIFNVNILSQFWLIREFLPKMIEKNSGHIVNVSSSLGFFGAYKVTDYCSTKFAVVGLSESLRIELKSVNPNNNIIVTTVCPFHVKTNLFNGFEMQTFKWMKLSNPPEIVAENIVNGILLNKHLIACPRHVFYILAAVKNMVNTTIQDYMMLWFGFNEAIKKYKPELVK